MYAGFHAFNHGNQTGDTLSDQRGIGRCRSNSAGQDPSMYLPFDYRGL